MDIRIHQILSGERSINADTAARLGRFFGNPPIEWLQVQIEYDLGCVQWAEIERDVIPMRIVPKSPAPDKLTASKPARRI